METLKWSLRVSGCIPPLLPHLLYEADGATTSSTPQTAHCFPPPALSLYHQPTDTERESQCGGARESEQHTRALPVWARWERQIIGADKMRNAARRGNAVLEEMWPVQDSSLLLLLLLLLPIFHPTPTTGFSSPPAPPRRWGRRKKGWPDGPLCSCCSYRISTQRHCGKRLNCWTTVDWMKVRCLQIYICSPNAVRIVYNL